MRAVSLKLVLGFAAFAAGAVLGLPEGKAHGAVIELLRVFGAEPRATAAALPQVPPRVAPNTGALGAAAPTAPSAVPAREVWLAVDSIDPWVEAPQSLQSGFEVSRVDAEVIDPWQGVTTVALRPLDIVDPWAIEAPLVTPAVTPAQ